jgi:hypothetical protein
MQVSEQIKLGSGAYGPSGSRAEPWPYFAVFARLLLAIAAPGTSVGQAKEMRIRAVPSLHMPAIGGRGTEILQDKNPNRAGAATLAGTWFDALDQVAQFDIFAQADVAQGVPDFGLQPHTRSTAAGGDVAIDEPTGSQN